MTLLRRSAAFFRDRYMTVDGRWLGVLRIFLGIILCVDVIRRWGVVTDFYSNDGFLPNHYSIYAPMGDHLFSIYHAFSTPGEVSVAFAFTLLIFLCFTFGYRTKLFHILSAICITSLNARNLYVENGGTIVVNLLTIWLLFVPVGRRFSIDAVRRTMRSVHETTAEQLNDGNLARPDTRPVVSIAVFGLLLQWALIYVSNAVTKTGSGWVTEFSSLHYFLQQDRIITWFGIFARENTPYWVMQSLTAFTLVIEYALPILIVFPFFQTWTRRIALLFAIGLHGGIAASVRLGPFSYVMTVFFVMLLGANDWRLVARWFGRRGRERSVVYDGDCGVCLFCVRLLRRFDVFQRLTFVDNRDESALPPALPSATFDQTIVVARPDGKTYLNERALFEIGAALPFGWVAVWWLRVPGLAWIGRKLYLAFANRRTRISAWLGLGVCGIESAAAVSSDPATPATPATSARGTARRVGRISGEALAVLFLVAMGFQAVYQNGWIRRSFERGVTSLRQVVTPEGEKAKRFVLQRPKWIAMVVDYPRILQGWSMFAPQPPFGDGRIVIDARTSDGRQIDPFTGEVPDFDVNPPQGWGHDQFWCDYHLKIHFKGNAHRRQFLEKWLDNYHRRTGRPEDRLVAYSVYWVGDDSAPPGELLATPLPPEELISKGKIEDPLVPTIKKSKLPRKPSREP